MKNFLKLSVMLAFAVVMTSCNCYNKMAKSLNLVEVKCTPEVLVLNNGKVAGTVSVSMPVDYFNEKAIVKVTPVMVYGGGEVAGTPFFYQGAAASDNYKVIKPNFAEDFEFDFTPLMRLSELQLRVEVKCKDEFVLINLSTGAALSSKEKAIVDADPKSPEALEILDQCGYTVAKGVNTLQQELRPADVMTMMASNYQRVTNSVEKSELVYSISSSQLSSKALKSDCVKSFLSIVDTNSKNDRATQNLSAQGYASPDGKEDFNDKLSSARSESGKKAMERLLKQYGLTIDASSYGEDWDGFKELVEASDIEDKNLILQVLSLYNSSTKREEEIKNLSAVYTELKGEILPKLRRTKMLNSVDLVGKSDEEMLALVEADQLDSLNVLEILHLCNDVLRNPNQKIALLKYAAEKYENPTAYNNLGVQLAKRNKPDQAIDAFKKAGELGAPSSEVSRNLTLAYLMKDNVAEAKRYAKGIDRKAMSMLAAEQGDYKEAAKELEGINKAIALIMIGDLDGANAAIRKDNHPTCLYLKAVIASLKGDLKAAENNLTAAVKKNKNMAKMAATDINLSNLFESGFKF